VELSNLEPLVGASPWVVTAVIGILVTGKIIALVVATRGADPKLRPAIIKALTGFFRWRL
jgi:hypothetical protein